VFSTLLFSLTVVSLPMLLEREVDFVTAMLASFEVVTQSPAVMLAWGALVAVALFWRCCRDFWGFSSCCRFWAMPLGTFTAAPSVGTSKA
jgi:uncharacterized membrane protein